jgi:hypothetical protein
MQALSIWPEMTYFAAGHLKELADALGAVAAEMTRVARSGR